MIFYHSRPVTDHTPALTLTLKNYALLQASRRDWLRVVKYLLSKGATDEDGDALRCATVRGNAPIVKALLDAGVGDTTIDLALRIASYWGHLEVIKVLLEAGANVHAWSDWALGDASGRGHLEIVKVLLEAGALVYSYMIPLAEERGHTEVAKLLREARLNQTFCPLNKYTLDLLP
jgi:ankyrin repeat protein